MIIAEDDPFAATILTSIVKDAAPQADVQVAPNGLLTLKLMRRHVPDLLLVDLHLPALSGIDLCSQLRGAGIADRCTVLCTSAHADRRELEALRALGFTRFIPKGDELSRQLPPLVADIRARRTR